MPPRARLRRTSLSITAIANRRGSRRGPKTARGAWERMQRAISAAGIEPRTVHHDRDDGLKRDR
jgi:hypothetical protein